mmetsp:Transcript_3102/g.5081  ORF Transcript_3102/g.5081 Transcript_3102/m.5081 type:complete len:164 (-) Transcript_3102:23-514(-)
MWSLLRSQTRRKRRGGETDMVGAKRSKKGKGEYRSLVTKKRWGGKEAMERGGRGEMNGTTKRKKGTKKKKNRQAVTCGPLRLDPLPGVADDKTIHRYSETTANALNSLRSILKVEKSMVIFVSLLFIPPFQIQNVATAPEAKLILCFRSPLVKIFFNSALAFN